MHSIKNYQNVVICKHEDRTPFLSQSFVVYKFVCQDFKSYYEGKTDYTLHERTQEHAHSISNKNEKSGIYEHLPLCTHYNIIAKLFKTDTSDFTSNQLTISQIRDNNINLGKGDNWNKLLFKELLMIKKHRPSLNT